MLRPAANADTAHADVAPVAESVALPRMLDLGADKCVPCKMMAPILDELKQDYAGSLTVDFIDVWKDPTAAQPYGIRVIPTQIFFAKDGTELFRHEGFFSREDILAKWRELGVTLPSKGA
ncbi:MAG: thioredoxin family protein [bacterium]|nr:thioredoxin family protein [bacterium]